MPTSNAIGHTIVARIKNTGSSPMRAPNSSPNSFINSANKRLCITAKTVIPIADEPVRIKNAFTTFRNFALDTKTISVIPRIGRITIKGMLINLMNCPNKGIAYMLNIFKIKKAKISQKITRTER
jgi:hypothetical protein